MPNNIYKLQTSYVSKLFSIKLFLKFKCFKDKFNVLIYNIIPSGVLKAPYKEH